MAFLVPQDSFSKGIPSPITAVLLNEMWAASRAGQMCDLVQKIVAPPKHTAKRNHRECAGESMLQKLLKKAEGEGGSMRGADAFLMYDTYGFPLELTQEVAATYGLTVDEEGFQTAMKEQRTRSKVPKTPCFPSIALFRYFQCAVCL